MGVLETVLNSRKFDLNDDVLMEFNDYFDRESRHYNLFSLDEEDIWALRNFVEPSGPETVTNFLLQEYSFHTKLAYIEIDYFGGIGTPSGILYKNGNISIPLCSGEGVINILLRELGIWREVNKDEFDSLDLGIYRRIYIAGWFIPICGEQNRSVENTLRLLREDEAIPDWLIPFADEDGGNLFCFSVREEDYSAIYYYDHEFEYGENPEEYVTYLAESVTIFINSLVEKENDEDGGA